MRLPHEEHQPIKSEEVDRLKELVDSLTKDLAINTQINKEYRETINKLSDSRLNEKIVYDTHNVQKMIEVLN